MPRPAFVAGLVALAALAAPAGAGAAPPGPRAAPTYGALPSGRFGSPDLTGKPKAIPAIEKVPGFVVTTGLKGNSGTGVALSDAPLKKPQGMLLPPATIGEVGGCYARLPRAPSVDDDGAPSTEWEGAMSWATPFWTTGPQADGGVVLVHREQIVERSGQAALEWTDAWLDLRSSGVRVRDSASVPLALVTTTNEVRVFAGRDDRSDGKRRVQIVVVRDKGLPLESAKGHALLSGVPASAAQWCGHQRVGLVASDGGSSAAIRLNAVVPEPAPGADAAGARIPPLSSGTTFRDLRVRPLAIHGSLSQTSREREPLLGVTAGWMAAEPSVERVSQSSPIYPEQLGDFGGPSMLARSALLFD